MDKETQDKSQEQKDKEYLTKVREEVRELLVHPGWGHRSLVFNDLLEQQGRLLESAVDGYELYRAQGALRVLAELQNRIIEMSEEEEEEKEDV